MNTHRQRQKISLLKHFQILRMFFTNYSKWYRLNDLTGTQTGTGRRRKRTKPTHVVWLDSDGHCTTACTTGFLRIYFLLLYRCNAHARNVAQNRPFSCPYRSSYQWSCRRCSIVFFSSWRSRRWSSRLGVRAKRNFWSFHSAFSRAAQVIVYKGVGLVASAGVAITMATQAQGFEQGRIKKLQDEREAIQKKTFTKWMNSFLEPVSCDTCKSPNWGAWQRCILFLSMQAGHRVGDLFADLSDGRVLIKLLEVYTFTTKGTTQLPWPVLRMSTFLHRPSILIKTVCRKVIC